MKTVSIILSIVMILTVASCEKSEDGHTGSLEFIDASDISETSFVVNWKPIPNEVETLFLEYSVLNTFNQDVERLELSDLSQTSKRLENLLGATRYYYRLSAILQDGSELLSSIEKISTSFTIKAVDFPTSDGLTIAASIYHLSSIESPKPAVIFMHEMGVFVNNWKGSDIVLDLVSKAYLCVVMDFRGHGNSSKLEDIGMLLTDKSLIAKDLIAAMDYVKTRPDVDADRFALVGASLGAIMAIAGNGYEEVKASVAVSGVRDGIYQIFPGLIPSSALYIVGELDIHPEANINFPEEAQAMYEISSQPKKIVIVPSTANHGTNLLTSDNLNQEVVNWIEQHIND